MLLDAANAGDVLGGDAQGLPLFFRAVVGHPDMHDAIPDDDVGRPGVNPLLPLQFGQEFLTNRAVVGGGVRGAGDFPPLPALARGWPG